MVVAADADPPMVGALPWDLLVALVWMALAWATIIFLVVRVWNDPHVPDGPDDVP